MTICNNNNNSDGGFRFTRLTGVTVTRDGTEGGEEGGEGKEILADGWMDGRTN